MPVKVKESSPHLLTQESIALFLLHERNNGASNDCLRQRKTHVMGLYEWLPEDKLVSYDRLRQWRQALRERGYSDVTIGNYVKSVNRYVDFADRGDLRFKSGRQKDITGQVFGYLTAIECTGEKDRNDYIWKCRCQCGKEVFYPATRMLRGNTLSCGCMASAHLSKANQYIDGTSIRSSLRDDRLNPDSVSGYTGVAPKRGKWQAYITYKGRRYSLGVYSNIEDAVKARALAKEKVIEDAEALLETYNQLHKNDAPLRFQKKQEKK